MSRDSAFVGSVAEFYEECLVPVLFEPYADDLVERAVALESTRILEIAAGTGAVTRKLAAALPDSAIVASDLNPDMLAIAARRGSAGNVSYQPADAQALPFGDGEFDLVLAQFGAMFFPDKVAAYREARRVLRPGGTFLFNVWDRLEANTGSRAIHDAVRDAVPEPKPEFIARTPFGYHDPAAIDRHLREAGFTAVAIETVARSSSPEDAARLARGMCLGSPLAGELAAHDPAVRERALAAATDAATALASQGGLEMSALVITASR
jgi:ubiquinone/menaquinone biosynthesis C-methylase UbiE